ncbi:MAG: hypothetical protein ACOY0T_23575 [Myxococcota bacterium]
MTMVHSLLVELWVHARLGHSVRASCHRSGLAAIALVALSCSRSGLDPGELAASGEPVPLPSATTPLDAGAPKPIPSVPDASLPLGSGGTYTDPACVPSGEACNGIDDDCNGRVDDLTPLPCPNGGFSYCVGGRQSECPSRCEACIPGSERVCFTSYCTFWGTQTCTADGRSFGVCRERRVPSECANAAGREGNIANLERCCIDNGYCCVDSQDLDEDGDRTEMLGRCDDVTCN